MTTEVKVGKDLVRITDGIFTTLRCTKCGKNLPFLEWECPNCHIAENVESILVKDKGRENDN